MIVFYVSGHGFGHATRTGAVIAALRRLAPDVPVAVRTEAPRWAFPAEVVYFRAPVDFSVVENPGALSLDKERTCASVRAFCATIPELVTLEARWLRQNRARLLVADIPFLPGLLSKETSIPAVAISNFSWHWILEQVIPGEEVLATIEEAYSHFAAALRLPLSPDMGWSAFPVCVNVPLVTPTGSGRDRQAIRRELGLPAEDRQTVLVAGRSKIPLSALRAAANARPEFDFVVNGDCAGLLPSNVHTCSAGFSEALRASSIVLSKLGYSTAAACIAEGKRLLAPKRSDFRESEIIAREAARYIPLREMTSDAYVCGDWTEDLDGLVNQPWPASHADSTGSEVCAEVLLRYSTEGQISR
jgi:L-arabinokinase